MWPSPSQPLMSSRPRLRGRATPRLGAPRHAHPRTRSAGRGQRGDLPREVAAPVTEAADRRLPAKAPAKGTTLNDMHDQFSRVFILGQVEGTALSPKVVGPAFPWPTPHLTREGVDREVRAPRSWARPWPEAVEDWRTVAMRATRTFQLAGAAGRGVAAGLVGVAVMTASEKAEQALTHRQNSYVPARALLTLLGRHPADDERPWLWNHAMHYGTGALLGALRGIWAAVGLRGPNAHLAHTVVRLAFDQTIENTTGVGAPPHTWPRQEQVIDLAHKAMYSLATGLVAERLVAPDLQSRRGTTSH